MLKRVSKQVEQKRQSYNQNFVDTYEINHRLKSGEWRSPYPPGMIISIDDFTSIIQDTYSIEDDVAEDLVFVYNSLTVTGKGELKPKLMKLSSREQNGPMLSGRTLKYKKKDGTTVGVRSVKMTDLEMRVNP